MTVFIYIFPIFAFGLVITGIVFLGIQQASDLAKNLAEEKSEEMKKSKIPGTGSPGRDGDPVQLLTTKSRP